MQGDLSFSDRWRSVFERWHPLVFAACAGLGALSFDLAGREGFRDLLQATVNLRAITIGFLATSKSILFTIGQKDIIVALKQTDKWILLIDYMMCAIYASFLLALVSGCLLLIKLREPEPWHRWAACFWVFCASFAFASSLRIIRFFARILKLK